MAKPNYDFAKRQRELAKKQKKEEKLKRKQHTDEAATSAPAPSTDGDSGGAQATAPDTRST